MIDGTKTRCPAIRRRPKVPGSGSLRGCGIYQKHESGVKPRSRNSATQERIAHSRDGLVGNAGIAVVTVQSRPAEPATDPSRLAGGLLRAQVLDPTLVPFAATRIILNAISGRSTNRTAQRIGKAPLLRRTSLAGHELACAIDVRTAGVRRSGVRRARLLQPNIGRANDAAPIGTRRDHGEQDPKKKGRPKAPSIDERSFDHGCRQRAPPMMATHSRPVGHVVLSPAVHAMAQAEPAGLPD